MIVIDALQGFCYYHTAACCAEAALLRASEIHWGNKAAEAAADEPLGSDELRETTGGKELFSGFFCFFLIYYCACTYL